MVNENFKRVEKKYLITAQQKEAVQKAISQYMEIDDFGEALISSAYLDDDIFSMISRSNEKPLYKEKIRYRAYGEDAGRALISILLNNKQDNKKYNNDYTVFFELKKKHKGIVYKRRIPVSLDVISRIENNKEELLDILSEIQPKDFGYEEYQIAKELSAAVKRHGDIKPKVITMCERAAWKPKDGEDELRDIELRFTFDSNLRYVELNSNDNNDDNTNEKQYEEVPEFSEERYIMEIKCLKAFPLWLVKILNENNCLPQSFSKCGTAANNIVRCI